MSRSSSPRREMRSEESQSQETAVHSQEARMKAEALRGGVGAVAYFLPNLLPSWTTNSSHSVERGMKSAPTLPLTCVLSAAVMFGM